MTSPPKDAHGGAAEAVKDPSAVGVLRGGVLRQHLGALAAANAGTIVGLALGWTSAAAGVQTAGAQGFDVSLEEWSWVSSLYTIGASLGSLAVGKLVFSLGRTKLLVLVAPVTFVAWALHTWATSVWMLYVGRLLVGFASGATCVATPIYVCEMSEPRIRGALSTYLEILLCFGIFVVYVLGKYLPLYWINVVCMAFSVVHLVGFVWFPDTPRWYMLRGRDEDAKKSLVFYRGPDHDVDAELELVRQGIKENASTATGWGALFSSKVTRKCMIFAVLLMMFQQITGVNAVTFYASKLFTEAGAFDADIASIIVASTELLAACVSFGFVDHLGRRPLLLVSGGFMGACTGLLGAYFFVKDRLDADVSSLTWLPVVLASVYMFTFSIGFGPVVWVFLGEIFQDNVKGTATAVSAATCWFFAFVVTKFYPGLSESLGNDTCYWAFFVLCVLACLFIGLLMPETKGKTLDEIQAELSAASKAKDIEATPAK